MSTTSDAAPTVAPAAYEARLDTRLPGRWARIALLATAPPALAGAVVAWCFDLWWLAALAAVIGALVPWCTRHHGRRYVATFRCVLDRSGLLVERGVWWRSQVFVPRERVQHTDVEHGPLARRWGLATLTVFTAGSSHGRIDIEDLRHSDALRLRDDLLDRHERPGS